MGEVNGTIPVGLCHCGCGRKTTISKVNRANRGIVKGKPARYVRGHGSKYGRSRAAMDRGNGICVTCKLEFPLAPAAIKTRKSGRCRECNKQWMRELRVRNAERYHATRLKRDYGITPPQYAKMAADQKYLCAICRHPEVAFSIDGLLRPLSVDHCHATGKIRGLLCNACNHGIGRFSDESEFLIRAAAYVAASQEMQYGLWLLH